MVTYNSLLEYHKQIGLWDSPEKFNRYGYVLSPEKFVINKEMQFQLNEIGKAVYQFQHDSLILAGSVQNGNGNHAKGMISRILKEPLNGLPFVLPNKLPPLCKVDVMVDTFGNLKIAEVDAYNPRAIAYALFLSEMHKDIGNVTKEEMLPGVFTKLSKFWEDSSLPVWVYSQRERYYEPVLRHMTNIIDRKFNHSMKLVNATEFEKIQKDSKFFMIPWGMQQPNEQETKRFLIEKYHENEESFIFPLVPWMGTKGLLGLVSKSYSNEVSSIVNECFTELDILRRYLPNTLLVSRKNQEALEEFKKENQNYVLKANVASGMKGVWMKDEDIQTNLLKALNQKNPAYTVQEMIEQKKFNFSAFDSNGELYQDDWYVRLVIHVDDLGNVVDAEVTGRREPDVHGAPDCIMLPCVLG